jgi:chromosome segregation ATPase
MAESGENEPSQQLNRLQATVKELRERLSYVEEERGMLVGQKEVLTSELEKALKERSESDLQVFQLSENLRELQYTRSFLDELVREKELLEGRVVLLTKELSEERARGRQQAEATGLLREETEHLHEAVRSSDSERKSAVLAFEEQGEVFHEKIQTFATRIRDLQSKLAKAIHEREASSSNANSMRRSFEQLKTDNGGMVSLMGTMEKKLNEYSQKESRMDELAASCKESAEQALLERDQAVANEAYLRQELSRLREVRVKEYDERERQHLGALTQAKEQAERECNVKDKAVAMLRHDNEHLRVACDRAQRDCESSEVRLQQVSATVETERRVVKDACRGLEQRVRGAEDACAKAESELERLRQERRTAQVSGERSEREAGRRERMNEERRSKAEAELAAMEEKVEALVDGKARAERDKVSQFLDS